MDTIEEAAASIQCSDIVLKMILVLGKRYLTFERRNECDNFRRLDTRLEVLYLF